MEAGVDHAPRKPMPLRPKRRAAEQGPCRCPDVGLRGSETVEVIRVARDASRIEPGDAQAFDRPQIGNRGEFAQQPFEAAQSSPVELDLMAQLRSQLPALSLPEAE